MHLTYQMFLIQKMKIWYQHYISREEISFLIHFALPSHSRSHEDFWAGIRMYAYNTVAHAKTMKIELSSEKVAGVAAFERVTSG